MKAMDLPSAEYIRSILDYSPETGEFRWKVRSDVPKECNTRWAGKITGCPNVKGYILIGINGRLYYAHRLAWLYMTGECPYDDVDHRDVNSSNNKWENLRRGTRTLNHGNRKISSKNTSGLKGASIFRRDGTWRAQIQVKGKNIHLGYYSTPEEAHKVYMEAAKKFFGEFARAG